jgi:hypothetical protein
MIFTTRKQRITLLAAAVLLGVPMSVSAQHGPPLPGYCWYCGSAEIGCYQSNFINGSSDCEEDYLEGGCWLWDEGECNMIQTFNTNEIGPDGSILLRQPDRPTPVVALGPLLDEGDSYLRTADGHTILLRGCFRAIVQRHYTTSEVAALRQQLAHMSL